MTITRRIYHKNDKPTLTTEQIERLNALKNRPIDLSDEPEDLDWSNAEHGKFIKQKIAVDDEVYTWLKKDGRNPQQRLNEILRWVMQGEVLI